MGLDMYLERIPNGMNPYRIENLEEMGYWRKANAIHKWFVENVQGGKDDCGIYAVSKDALIKLKNLCCYVIDQCEMIPSLVYCGRHYKRVNGNMIEEPFYRDGAIIKDPSVAQELLPTSSGFFFGSTDYNDSYVEDLKLTIKFIDNILETTDFEKFAIYYASSW